MGGRFYDFLKPVGGPISKKKLIKNPCRKNIVPTNHVL